MITQTQTPIVPILTRSEVQTSALTRFSREAGLLVLPILYRAVPMDALRLRCTVTAAHTQEELDYVLKVLTRAGRELGVLPADGPE